MEKYKIEKDSVQETLIIPLYGRRLCSRRFPGLYQAFVSGRKESGQWKL